MRAHLRNQILIGCCRGKVVTSGINIYKQMQLLKQWKLRLYRFEKLMGLLTLIIYRKMTIFKWSKLWKINSINILIVFKIISHKKWCPQTAKIHNKTKLWTCFPPGNKACLSRASEIRCEFRKNRQNLRHHIWIIGVKTWIILLLGLRHNF